MKIDYPFTSYYTRLLIQICTIVFCHVPVSSEDIASIAPCGRPPTSTPLSGPGQLTHVDIPWSAAITLRGEATIDYSFAAILISPSLVLASAHYLHEAGTYRFHVFPFSSYLASMGTRKWGDPTHSDPNAVTISVKHIQIHPQYKSGQWINYLNDFALFHLSEPVTDDHVQPICLPSSDDTALITELRRPTPSDTEEELVLTGWNRNIEENLFLRLKTQGQDVCFKLWQGNNESNSHPYINKWCAVVGKQNDHVTCIHKDVGGVRLINGSYYLTSIVDNFYSTNNSRRCYSGAEFYFRNLEKNTLQWIEDNLRCGADNFTCGSGECASLSSVCDQIKDCDDASDEEPHFCRGRNFCTEDEFACGVYGACIPEGRICDGEQNCDNGEDEMGCRQQVPMVEIVAGLTLTFLGISVLIMLLWRRHVNKLKKEIRNLTPTEVRNFIYGYPQRKLSMKINRPSLPHYYVGDPIQSPWDKMYTIAPQNIKIGEEINRGNFGIVYKATLLKAGAKDSNSQEEVAVKTNLKTVGVEDFKILLTELKIMAYVGQHANVIRFFGACTENIMQREVYLVVEYCPNGNLRDFLLRNGKYFVNCDLGNANGILNDTSDFSTDYQYDNSQYGFISLYDLILWSTQIASGMEYLASKMIVHADIAARNILLSPNLDVKISDFGLSRQLECSSGIYIKSSDEPLPWKWLAIETLQSNKVSEKTDVWAFGVTMWEIFTLGETPYSASLGNETLLNDLISGYRLEQPKHASDEIYKIMLNCWMACETQRPTFATLRDEMISIIHKFNGSCKRSSGNSELKEAQLQYLQILGA